MVIDVFVNEEVKLGVVDPGPSFLWVSIKSGWLSQFQFLGFGRCCGGCGHSHSLGAGLLVTHEERISCSWYGAKWCQGFELKK